MSSIINFKEKFKLFSDLWSPKIIGQFDNYQIKAAKMLGEFIWHSHDDADECFIVIEGELTILLRNYSVDKVVLKAGESFIVPKGIEHKTVAEQEVHVLFIEKVGTINTGDQSTASQTVTQEEWI